MHKYITELGDTFERISWKTLGNSRYMKEIINLNREYVETLIFDAGIEIKIPEVEVRKKKGNIWKKHVEQV